MKKYIKLIVGVFCAVLLASSAFAATAPATAKTTTAQPMLSQQAAAPLDGWIMTLGGAGATKTSGTATTGFGVDVSLGKQGKLVLPLEAGIRQNFTYTDPDNLVFGTKLYADWTVLQYKKLDLFVGVSGGALYGNTPLNWSLGPEGGARLWVKQDVAVVARVEYPFSVTGNSIRNDDTLKYFLGLAVKF